MTPSMPLTGAEAVAAVIAAQPKPVVYGMPGGYMVYLWDALIEHRHRIAAHLVRQESLATVMAEAHGRLTGQPAFVIAQGAWVLGNAGIGVMEAHLGASPMVLLIDATDGGAWSHLGPYQGGFGGYGSYDLPAAMKAVTKRTFVASDPVQALQMTQLAIKHATTGEPGPVAVIFTARALVKSVGARSGPLVYPDRSYRAGARPVASEASLVDAADVLRRAARPVIVAGGGVRLARAEAVLRAFADRHDVPVATTPAGKGVFPEDHELALGVIGGFGHDSANAAVGEADLVLALGTKLGASDTANQHPDLIDVHRQRLLQVDIEPLNIAWTFPADVGVQGDLSDALPRLSGLLEDYHGGGRRRVEAARAGGWFDRPFRSGAGQLSGRDVVRVLSESLPPDAVVTCDAGENRLFVLRDYQTKAGGTVLQPNGGGGMGYAIPAAMASAVDFPGRAAVAVCGDGGFAMTLHGLVSAVELELDISILVLNNQALGWVRSGQGNRIIASELKDFDYAAIAAAIGCHAVTVDTLDEARAAIEGATRRKGVSVIVAWTSVDDRYQDLLAAINKSDIYAIPQRRIAPPYE